VNPLIVMLTGRVPAPLESVKATTFTDFPFCPSLKGFVPLRGWTRPGMSPASIAPPRQEDEMVPSTKGDNVADILREQHEDEALAREQARQAHTLMPSEIAAQLPPLYANDGQSEDAIAHLKLFTPWTSWTWYASEYDPAERLCFGVVVGHERELGYFSLVELEEIRGPAGLRIERDLHWKPRPLKECR